MSKNKTKAGNGTLENENTDAIKENPPVDEPNADTSEFVTKADIEDITEKISEEFKSTLEASMSKNMTMFMSKLQEAHTGKVGSTGPLEIDEIGTQSGIDRVTENDFAKDIESEVFMNQKLEIIVHKSSDKEDVEVVTPTVNGKNQPIFRGVRCLVRRKYVEALAHSVIIRFEQRTPDASRPDKIQMVPVPTLTYPFAVYHDPHPNGRQWLDAMLQQAA